MSLGFHLLLFLFPFEGVEVHLEQVAAAAGTHGVQALAAELDHQHLFYLTDMDPDFQELTCHFDEHLLAFCILRSAVQTSMPYQCSQSGQKTL
jgi:hypothetical protein